MIRLASGGPSPTLETDLPAGSRAWIDADWIGTDAHDVPAVVLDGAASDADAAAVLLDLAARAAAPAEGVPPDRVEVVGSGAVADAVRRRTGARPGAGRPACIVELTGAPSAIAAAVERVDDGGTVVLAGEPLGRRVELNLYKDIHRRGLRVLGVAGPADDARGTGAELPAPTRISAGQPLAGGSWYRLEA